MTNLDIKIANATTGGVVSTDGLKLTGGSSTNILYQASTTVYKNNGKWYWELEVTNLNAIAEIGIISSGTDVSKGFGLTYRTESSGSYLRNFDSNLIPYGNKFVRGDVIGVALDIDNKKIEFLKNGISLGSPSFTFSKNAPYSPFIAIYNSTSLTFNFGDTDFKHAIPTGYLPYNKDVNNKVLLKSKNKVYSLQSSENLMEFPVNSLSNFIKYGTSTVTDFNKVQVGKSYILQDAISKDTDGLWKQELNRKPLSIKFE